MRLAICATLGRSYRVQDGLISLCRSVPQPQALQPRSRTFSSFLQDGIGCHAYLGYEDTPRFGVCGVGANRLHTCMHNVRCYLLVGSWPIRAMLVVLAWFR